MRLNLTLETFTFNGLHTRIPGNILEGGDDASGKRVVCNRNFFPFLSFLFLFQLFSLLYSKIQIWEMDRKG